MMQRSEAIASIAAAVAADIRMAAVFVGHGIGKLARRVTTSLPAPARDDSKAACDCESTGGYRRR